MVPTALSEDMHRRITGSQLDHLSQLRPRGDLPAPPRIHLYRNPIPRLLTGRRRLPPGSVDGERACDSGGVAHVGRLTCPEDQATTKISLAAAHFVITHQIQSKFTTPRKRVFAVAGGRPKVLRMDNGPELVSQALQRAATIGVGLPYIPPGPHGTTITSNH